MSFWLWLLFLYSVEQSFAMTVEFSTETPAKTMNFPVNMITMVTITIISLRYLNYVHTPNNHS